ncbi:MAG: sugar ABC transporter permease [Chloroflexota bacterium]|nr:sugar ABC transporter permease [Chloroflexota bacterium]
MDTNNAAELSARRATVVAGKRKIRWGDALAPYLFISPFILAWLTLFIGPAIYSLILSFYRYKGYGTATFLGFQNYRSILTYHVFWTMLGNTIFYWLAHVIPLMVFAFLLAVLVRSKLVRWKSFFKPVIFLPNVIAVVASALVFQSLFGTQYGVLNSLLGAQIPWLQDPKLTRYVVVLLLVWRGVGWWFVIFLAGLTAINTEVEEAALVDGASAWQQMRHITLPLMRNTFLFAFVMDAISSFRLFTEVNVLVGTGGGLAPVAVAPILNLLLSNLRGAQFGMSAAVGWILFVLVVAVTYIQFRLFQESAEEVE